MADDSLTQNPVTAWIQELRVADESAATRLWNHFFDRLRQSALKKLRPDTRRVYDEEDAALSAFNSFCNGIAAGRFPDLQDREGLLALLLVITGRKVSHRHRFDHQQRRDIRRTLPEAVFDSGQSGFDQQGRLQQLKTAEPAPEFVVAFSETCDNFFANLDDPKLQQIAALRIEGYNDSEIATQLDCARSTIQRRLEIIRRECEALEEPSE